MFDGMKKCEKDSDVGVITSFLLKQDYLGILLFFIKMWKSKQTKTSIFLLIRKLRFNSQAVCIVT